jgi:hypothetical protein
MSGSPLELAAMLSAIFVGFLIGIVVGYKLHGDEPTYTNPTDPRTRPSDYPTNAGFGPDYPFREKVRKTK